MRRNGSVQGGTLRALLAETAGGERAARLMQVVVVPQALVAEAGDVVTRAVLAQVLNMLLLDDLLGRVPAAARYAERSRAAGKTILHDHGAVRTVALAGMGALPAGEEAIVRVLRPLGYALHGVYPLERLKMTGRSYAHVDLPEQIAQFFLSELHPERFSVEFQQTVARVTGSSSDALTAVAAEMLQEVETEGRLGFDDAVALLPVLVKCFGRQHGDVREADYEALLRESAEMAWIATEGNVFNHVTDRVEDVDRLSEEQKALGEPMKPTVETSQTGRVRQTAFLAAKVARDFVGSDGGTVTREVPGSFLEFITRMPIPEDGKLDLGFDSSNAQAIL